MCVYIYIYILLHSCILGTYIDHMNFVTIVIASSHPEV